MSHCDRLLKNYQRFVRLPWQQNLSGKQRIWFAVYPPSEERRIRARLQEFQVQTVDAGHRWKLVDFTQLTAKWFAAHPYRDGYLSEPAALAVLKDEVRQYAAGVLRNELQQQDVGDNTVLALMGAGSLFGFTSLSAVLDLVEGAIKGRMLVFFPGEYERNQYRFMDAGDGFNYMAIPITSNESMLTP